MDADCSWSCPNKSNMQPLALCHVLYMLDPAPPCLCGPLTVDKKQLVGHGSKAEAAT